MLGARSDPGPDWRARLDWRAALISLIAAATSLCTGGELSGAGEGGGSLEEKVLRDSMARMLERRFCSTVWPGLPLLPSLVRTLGL